jgi:hypothetical protein
MKKYSYNFSAFYDEKEISYYLLGAWMTDGCVINRAGKCKKTALVSKDKDWLINIKDLICPELPVTNIGNSYVITINSTELSDWLISKGCVPRKSLILKFPKVPKKYLSDFIRGSIDGDGCIMTGNYKHSSGRIYQYNQCYLCGGSKKFIKSFAKLLDSKNIKYSYTERDPVDSFLKDGRKIHSTSKQYKVSINSKKSLKDFLEWIYYPDSFGMPRKINLSKIILENLKLK